MDTNLARLEIVTPLEAESFADCLLSGLRKTPKEIACKYFYDEAGSRLFDAICELPEYYQTRTEVALLRRHAIEIAALMGPGIEIVGCGAKAARLHAAGYFRRLSARRGACPGGGLSGAAPAPAGGRLHPAAGDSR